MSAYWASFVSSPGWGIRGVASNGAEAYALGVAGGLSLGLAVTVESFRPFFVFVVLLSVFHFTEWLFVAVYHTHTCSTDSFLIPHSRSHSIAMAAALIEYFLEWGVFGILHRVTPMFWIGLLICIAGQLLRWVAFVHAGHAFTHLIEERKSEKHHLVTEGVYRYVRHPGYAGWFYWSIGTQLVLGNPFCIVAYALASWRFFNDRIAYEEELLESPQFFGQKYADYKRSTPTFIPLIK